MRVLVIPTGDTASSLSPYGDGSRTWAEIATENGCDLVEALGSQWCVDNHVDGLGIASEYVAPPAPVPPAPQLGDVLYATLAAAEAPMAASDLAATLAEAIAPLLGGV